jgi:IMP cyclohydrolase
MYVGRIVAVAQSKGGANAILYRVSSRSFPNRMAVDISGTLAVVPRPGAEADIHNNPYIAYNALRLTGSHAVAISKAAKGASVTGAVFIPPAGEPKTFTITAAVGISTPSVSRNTPCGDS